MLNAEKCANSSSYRRRRFCPTSPKPLIFGNNSVREHTLELRARLLAREVYEGEGSSFVTPRTATLKLESFEPEHALSIYRRLLENECAKPFHSIFEGCAQVCFYGKDRATKSIVCFHSTPKALSMEFMLTIITIRFEDSRNTQEAAIPIIPCGLSN